MLIEAMVVQVAVAGSYNSAVSNGSPLEPTPPQISTFALGNKVALWPHRALLMEPVVVHFLVAGSYNSALKRAVETSLNPEIPPATSTLPLVSKVAECAKRALTIGSPVT